MALPDQCHVDLETLDTRETSRILSIGAVFNDEKFYVEIDQSLYPTDSPFTESKSTKEWWASQGGFHPTLETLTSPYEATMKFHRWLSNQTQQLSDWEIWANSPSFDCAMLRYHMQFFNTRPCWNFWQERDVRTAKAIAKAMKLPIRSPQNPHHALQDAANQRVYVEQVYNILAQSVQTAREANYHGHGVSDNGTF